MLHITASTKLLKEELRIASGLIRDIMGVLSDPKSLDNLTQSVGVFVLEMPEFKVLTKDSESAKRILRKVCTGEIKPAEAFCMFDLALKEVNTLLNMFDSTTSF